MPRGRVNMMSKAELMAKVLREQKSGSMSIIQLAIKTGLHWRTIEMDYIPIFEECYEDIEYDSATRLFKVHRLKEGKPQ